MEYIKGEMYRNSYHKGYPYFRINYETSSNLWKLAKNNDFGKITGYYEVYRSCELNLLQMCDDGVERTALDWVIYHGNTGLIKWFSERPCTANIDCTKPMSLMMQSCPHLYNNKYINITVYLAVWQFAKNNDLDGMIKSNYLESCPDFVISKEIANLICEGKTALDFAYEHNNSQMAQLLLTVSGRLCTICPYDFKRRFPDLWEFTPIGEREKKFQVQFALCQDTCDEVSVIDYFYNKYPDFTKYLSNIDDKLTFIFTVLKLANNINAIELDKAVASSVDKAIVSIKTGYKIRIADLENRLTQQDTRNAELDTRNAELEARNAELEARNAGLAELEARYAELAEQLAEQDAQIAEQDALINKCDAYVNDLVNTNTELNQKISTYETQLADIAATAATANLSEKNSASGTEDIDKIRSEYQVKIDNLIRTIDELSKSNSKLVADHRLEISNLECTNAELSESVSALTFDCEKSIRKLVYANRELDANIIASGKTNSEHQAQIDNLIRINAELAKTNYEYETHIADLSASVLEQSTNTHSSPTPDNTQPNLDFLSESPDNWTSRNVTDWVNRLCPEFNSDTFIVNCISGPELLELTVADMENLALPLAVIKNLQKYIPMIKPNGRSLSKKSFSKTNYAAVLQSTPFVVDKHEIFVKLRELIEFYCGWKNIPDNMGTEYFTLLVKWIAEISDLSTNPANIYVSLWINHQYLADNIFSSIICEILRSDSLAAIRFVTPFVKGLSTTNYQFDLPTDLYLYRGSGIPRDELNVYVEGQIYRTPNLLSTTSDTNIAQSFLNKAQGQNIDPVLYIFCFCALPNNSELTNNDIYSNIKQITSNEYLFLPYSTFTVGSVIVSPDPSIESPHIVYVNVEPNSDKCLDMCPIIDWH